MKPKLKGKTPSKEYTKKSFIPCSCGNFKLVSARRGRKCELASPC
jgi:hypothetical protein